MKRVLDERAYCERLLDGYGETPAWIDAAMLSGWYATKTDEDGAHVMSVNAAVDEAVKQCRRRGRVNIDSPASLKSMRAYAAKKRRNGLREVAYLPLTANETDTLIREANKRGRAAFRVLFALIVLARYGQTVSDKRDGWVCDDAGEVMRCAGVKCSGAQYDLILHTLYKDGCVSFPRRPDNLSVKVTVKPEGEETWRVPQVDNIPAEVRLFIDTHRKAFNKGVFREPVKRWRRCKVCGVPTEATNNSVKYCPSCAAVVKAKQVAACKRRHKTETQGKNP